MPMFNEQMTNMSAKKTVHSN